MRKLRQLIHYSWSEIGAQNDNYFSPSYKHISQAISIINMNTTFTSIISGNGNDSLLDDLTLLDYTYFSSAILVALEILNFLVKWSGRNGFILGMRKNDSNNGIIPVRGKHLDELSFKDYLFISLNKAATPPFVYFLLKFMYLDENSLWSMESMGFQSVLLPLPFLFVIYDFFYTILHWALHVKAIYGFIHKHHHHQKAPSRANVDAVNVHPIEFFLGEYNHLLAVFLWCRFCDMQLHIASVLIFLALGGSMASLNHTRFDVVLSLPFFGGSQSLNSCDSKITLYDTKAHDVHHRIPQSNYGQYIMLWDWIFGTYR